MSELSPEATRAVQQDSVEETPVMLLRFRASGSGGVLNVTWNTEPVVSNSVTYLPVADMRLALLASHAAQLPTPTLKMGLNDSALTKFLRETNDEVFLDADVVFAATPDVVQFRIRNIKLAEAEPLLNSITMQFGISSLFLSTGPKLAFTPEVAPGAFA